MISAIRVNAEREGPKTILKESYHSAPYKLIYYGSPTFHEHLEMIIMSASPGVMDGDVLNIDVHVKEMAQLKLYTQSFNKVHPMRSGASQHTRAVVGKNAIFQYIPHPITPFKDAIFLSKNEVHLDKDSILIWGDIICPGRVHMKESFEFTSLHSVTKIFRDKKLVFVDNQFLNPAAQPVRELLFFEGYTHQATLLFSASFAKELKTELDEILVQEYSDITFGFTRAADDVVLIRALGHNGELLYDFLLMLGQLCWEFSRFKLDEQNELDGEHIVKEQEKTGTEPNTAKPVRKKTTEKNAATAPKKQAGKKKQTKKVKE